MFNDTSIIKEVNIITKFICYILVLLIIILCNKLLLLSIGIVFLSITKQFSKLFKFNIFVVILMIIDIFYPHFIWLNKLFVLIIYTLLLNKVTKLIELRYVIEKTLYRFKTKKITYRLFYSIYFIKNFNKYFKEMLLLKDDYGIKNTPKFIYFVLKQSYKKAMLSKQDFIEINSLRFYNYSSQRTYIEKVSFERWDAGYLVCHIIIFMLTMFYGR